MMADNDAGIAGAAGAADEQLKKRARRRLVGAVALVLFAVIVLPMVMDHQPRPTGPEIQVRIPGPDSAESRPSAAKPSSRTGTEPLRKPESEGSSGGAVPEKPAAAVVVEAKPRPEPSPKLPAKPESKPETAEVQPRVAAPAASAADSGRDDQQWVVQLGAYQEQGRVKLLMDKIKQLGLPAFTEKVDTAQGPRTRVRAGPFPNRDAAVKAQERIKIIGVGGPVAPK